MQCILKRRYNESVTPSIVSWQNGTDAEIAAMIQAADAGTIDLSDYWSVGDERVVHLSAMQSSDVFESGTEAQDVVWVLMNEGYAGTGNEGVHFVVGQKDCLAETGRINATGTVAGSWEQYAMRSVLNTDYYNAIPSVLRSALKTFVTYTGYSENDNLQSVNDKVALFAEKEVTGDKTFASNAESVLSQIKYYETAANRIKNKGVSANTWWLRSPNYGYSAQYCGDINPQGTPYGIAANNYAGVAPFVCI